MPKQSGWKSQWTAAEIERLRELAAKMPQIEVAKILDRPRATVCRKAKELGIKFVGRAGGGKLKGQVLRPWTKAEELQLWGFAGKYTSRQIARKLRRTRASVLRKARALGIRLTPGMTLAHVAAFLKVAEITVARHRDLLGQRWRIQDKARPYASVPRAPEPEEVAALARSILEEPKYGGQNMDLRHLKRVASGGA